jgi:hypothetical protein
MGSSAGLFTPLSLPLSILIESQSRKCPEHLNRTSPSAYHDHNCGPFFLTLVLEGYAQSGAVVS